MKSDVYERVTQQIITALESGVKPWHQPWAVEHTAGCITRPLRGNLVPYRGINVLMLWGEATAKGYAAPVWMTFKQAHALGAHIRRGEHGSLVVYASTFKRSETDGETGADNGPETGCEETREIPFMKGYTVFNVDQIEGLPEHFYARPAPHADAIQRIAGADAFVTATGATIQHGGTRACYAIGEDVVRMPVFEAFRDAESYYSTLVHELTHWTRHPSRLDRDLGRNRWGEGDIAYAMEELVAELGAAFMLADLALSPQVRDEHASYIASWLTVLKDDKRAIFTAAAHAQCAADYLNALQPQQQNAEAA